MRRRVVPHAYDPLLALRRRPRLRRVLVAALAGSCGLAVLHTVQAAEDAAASWGRLVPVLVATDDLAPGDRLDDGNTRVERRPERLVPDGVLAEVPAGARVAEPVYAGDVVRTERLAPGAVSAVAARLPDGTSAVAIPVEPGTTPPLRIGDHVDVLVALPPDAAGAGPPGFVLAAGAVVVDVTDAAVTVAVRAADAPRVAVAFATGAVTLALVGA